MTNKFCSQMIYPIIIKPLYYYQCHYYDLFIFYCQSNYTIHIAVSLYPYVCESRIIIYQFCHGCSISYTSLYFVRMIWSMQVLY